MPNTKNFKGKRKPQNKRKDDKYSRNDYSKDNKSMKGNDKVNHKDSTNAPWFWNRGIDFNEATRVPFDKLGGQLLGIRSNTPSEFQSKFDWHVLNESPAYGMSIDIATSIGLAQDYSDPVNRRFNDIYSTLLALRTSDLPFQQADLALFCINYAQIGGYIHEAIRALAVSYTYSRTGVMWPNGILALCGFNHEGIIGKQDDLLIKLNDIITDYNSFTLPDFLAIGDRFAELGRNLYLDQANTNNGCQYYVFRNRGFHIYDDTPSSAEDVNKLVYTKLADLGVIDKYGLRDMDRFLEAIIAALSAWRNSTDFATIRGAILNGMQKGAFNDSVVAIAPAVLYETPSIVPMDDHLLSGIHNMITVPAMNLDITQDPSRNIIICEPMLDREFTDSTVPKGLTGYAMDINGLPLDAIKGDTSPDMVMISTRFIPCLSERGTDIGVLLESGTEIPIEFQIYYSRRLDDGTTSISWTPGLHTFNSYYAADGSISLPSVRSLMSYQYLLSQFSYSPRMLYYWTAHVDELPSYSNFKLAVDGGLWNMDTVTPVSAKQLSILHRSALRSVFTPYSSK